METINSTKNIQIRLLKADFPGIDENLFETTAADQITGHFILEYPALVISLFKKNAFYLHLYSYLKMANKHSLNEIYTRIAQDYQNFEINAFSMN